ncbi:polysaccharide deacetylase family protein [Leptothrix ochracea]|uniref:polysaccharide deacetylase family protein n=1 Tax=Leptothrix ochracea TaxID=735331 RepID=UPI0034E1E9A6
MAGLFQHLLRMAAGVRYPGGDKKPGLPILMYHRVLAQPDPLQPEVPDAAWVNMQLALFAQSFNVLPLPEAVQLMRENRLPPRAMCLTFDDGYRDNHDVALPLLRSHNIRATVFVASGFLGDGRIFNDTVVEAVRRLPSGTVDLRFAGMGIHPVGDFASRRALMGPLTQNIKYQKPEERAESCRRLQDLADSPLPDDLMMRPEHVQALHRQGIDIGGHTVNHPILALLDDVQARHEIEANRAYLRDLTGETPRTFAFPNGKPNRDYTKAQAQLVRQAGYEAAVSTAYGIANASQDLFELPRFVAIERTPLRMGARMLRVAKYQQPSVAQ